MLSLALLLISITIEQYIGNNSGGIILSQFLSSMNNLINVYLLLGFLLSDLKVRSFTIFILYSITQIISYYTISQFYSSVIDFPYHLIIVGFIVFFGLILSGYTENLMNQFKKSYFFTNLLTQFFGPFNFTYEYYWFLISYQLKYISIFEADTQSFLTLAFISRAVIDYIVIDSPVIVAQWYRILFTERKKAIDTKKKKAKVEELTPEVAKYGVFDFIKGMIKSLIFFSIMNFLFYLNFSSVLSSSMYDLLMKSVSHPHNLIIYNSLPLNPDTRYKIILLIGAYFRRNIL